MNVIELNENRPANTFVPGVEFFTSHPEADRTLRMDTGGICQYCARKAQQRVELYSPLWLAGPIMYGECCLPLAQAALQNPLPVQQVPTVMKLAEAPPKGRMWLTAAITAGIGFLAMGMQRLLQVTLF